MSWNNRTLSALLVAAVAWATAGASAEETEPIPYGHADYVPSAEHPAYFRMGNGAYPGATPPLEWWEGTPVQRDNPYKDRHRQPKKIWDFADDKAKNIRWKVPVPGWTLTHPVVVGDRIFVVGHPYWVACYQADTGKELWRKAISVPVAKGMEGEEAEKLRKVGDLALALRMLGGKNFVGGEGGASIKRFKNHKTFSDETIAAHRQHMDQILAVFERHRCVVEAMDDKGLMAAYEKDKATVIALRDSDDVKAALRKKPSLFAMAGYVEKRYGIDTSIIWQGYCGFADSALASDGERVYAVFQQGQIACLDLEGNLVWARHDGDKADFRASFHRIPLLHGDLLLVRSRKHDKKANASYIAHDKRTGEEIWRTPDTPTGYVVPRILTVTCADGERVDLLVGCNAVERGLWVLRIQDGETIGHVPREKVGRGALLSVHDDVIVYSSTDDRGGGPTTAYRLSMSNRNAIQTTKLWTLTGKERVLKGGTFPSIIGDYRLANGGHSVNVFTGSKHQWRHTRSFMSGGVIVGDYFLSPVSDVGTYPYGRRRKDRKAMSLFRVFDMRDPTAPRLISNRNLLGFDGPPADSVVDTYLKELGPLNFAGCYKGTASYFGGSALMGGVVPKGDRLYIQSSAWLYCIADDLQGRPQDDPAHVERIRAATGLKVLRPYVNDESPQYRYEALRRLNALVAGGTLDLPEDLTAPLTALARTDIYHPIVAQALNLLGLDAGEPGYTLLVDRIKRSWRNAKNRYTTRPVLRQLEALGAAGIDVLLAMMANQQLEPSERLKAAAAYRDMARRTADARDRLIAAATRADDLDPVTRTVLVYALTQSHPEDEAVLACMREQLQVKVDGLPKTLVRYHPHALAKEYIKDNTTE